MYLNLPRYPRYLTAAAGSAFMTVGIVFLMVQLVTIDDSGFVERPPVDVGPLWRVPDEPIVETIDRRPKPPPVVDPQPPRPPMDRTVETTGRMEIAAIEPKLTGPGVLRSPTLMDGEQIPIVKVAPVYPNRAKQRGIEGYVILAFTITPTGATADASVIESSPDGVFDRSALSAVRKFKYKPKVVDGEPQSVYNVQHRLTYELTNG